MKRSRTLLVLAQGGVAVLTALAAWLATSQGLVEPLVALAAGAAAMIATGTVLVAWLDKDA
jgi:hypothetical protein